MLEVLVFNLYRFIFMPVALFVLHLFAPFWPAKIKQMIKDRKSPQKQALVARPICIHASSGEIEYAKPVVRAIKAAYPQIPIIVTYSSPSALRLTKDMVEVDAFIPAPWDHRDCVKDFLDYARPLVVLFSRTDVWPEFAYQLSQRQIPGILFAATLAKNSSRLRGLGRILTSWSLRNLTQLFCVNEEDERIFKSLNISTPISVHGDTRYDQVIYRLAHAKAVNQMLRPPASKKIFIAGSTWPEDEQVLLPALSTWIQQGGLIIIAPHEIHLEKISTLQRNLHEKNIQSFKYSDGKALDWQSHQVLILDQIGILAEIYKWGDLAFVGGSFKDKVHSVMEPLACGMRVLVGPHHHNNREALHFTNYLVDGTQAAVQEVQDSESLKSELEIGFKLAEKPSVREAISQHVHQLSGASQKVCQSISGYLGESV